MKKFLLLVIISFIGVMIKNGLREINQTNFENSLEATKVALIEKANSEGIKDFASIKPYPGNSFEVSVDYEPSTYPYCDEIYKNVPESAKHPLEVCRKLRNAETCEYSYSQKSDLPGFEFAVYTYDEGSDVYLFNGVIDYWIYLNGMCRLRQDDN